MLLDELIHKYEMIRYLWNVYETKVYFMYRVCN